MTIRRFVVPIAVDADGDAEVYSPVLSGKIVSLRYLKTDFADGVDFVVTTEDSGETVWSEENVNASATRHPRAATHSTAGAAALYAAGGTAVNDKIAVSQERIKIVVANGGVSKTGALHITIDG
jgi:hypothetical protein